MPIDKIHTHVKCIGCGVEFDIRKQEEVDALNDHKCSGIVRIGYIAGKSLSAPE